MQYRTDQTCKNKGFESSDERKNWSNARKETETELPDETERKSERTVAKWKLSSAKEQNAISKFSRLSLGLEHLLEFSLAPSMQK